MANAVIYIERAFIQTRRTDILENAEKSIKS